MLAEQFKKHLFDIIDVDSEIRADQLCYQLLTQFRDFLLHEANFAPEDAGKLAGSADYFLRDFIIGDRHENIFDVTPYRVKQFAGNWYIIKNMEPNMPELENYLAGISSFFRYLEKMEAFDTNTRKKIDVECEKIEYYSERIESFWDLKDNYGEWDAEIPLKATKDGKTLQ